MTDCPLSTTRLMSPPYSLGVGDAVVTRLFAENDAGKSDPDVCLDESTTIRTNPCVPMNFRRDSTNAEDELFAGASGPGSKLCYVWDKCRGDTTVNYKLYSQEWDTNSGRALIGSTPLERTTRRDDDSFCMPIPDTTSHGNFRIWVETHVAECGSE